MSLSSETGALDSAERHGDTNNGIDAVRVDQRATSTRSYFSAVAFRQLVRARMSTARLGQLGHWTPPPLAVGRLDRAPDVADAWVFGVFAAMLGRVPDRVGLEANAARLRRGDTPSDVVAGVLTSEEAQHLGAELPKDLDAVFVTGVYLAVLGRRPDVAGLESNRGALAAHAVTHQEILDAIIGSEEAAGGLRFPPAERRRRQDSGAAVSIQESAAGRFSTEEIYGLPTRGMFRQIVSRRRGVRSAIREIVTASARSRQVTVNTARQVEVLAADRDQTLSEVLISRGWQWRVDRGILERLDTMTATLNRLSDRVAAIELELSDDARRRRGRSTGSE